MFRNEDYDKINSELKNIKNKVYTELYNHEDYEPSLKEIILVNKIILNYIKKKERLIYGGFAQNKFIIKKNIKDSFYRIQNNIFFTDSVIADIEFYSPEPLVDLKNLIDEIYKNGHKIVEGKEGIHSTSYKIFVNYLNYCDITYLPINIYNKLPYLIVDNLKLTHPNFMLLDAYKIITDPMTSYFRLDKVLNRFKTLLNYYPLDIKYNNIIILKKNKDILNFIKKNIICDSNLILIGLYSYNYYAKKLSKDYKINVPYYELITDKYVKNVNIIYNILKNKFNNITTKEYYPFAYYIDYKTEFYHNNNLILILYKNNNRCTIYKYLKHKNIYIGAFNLTLMYFLFNYYYYLINNKINIIYFKKDMDINKYFFSLFINLIYIKNKYLHQKKITILDKSPFRDFTLKCIGTPINECHQSFLKGSIKKKKGKTIKYKYKPSSKNKK